MSNPIEPTIGRKVWFWPSKHGGDAETNNLNPEQPFDATVIFVHSRDMVSLDITDHAGSRHVRTMVALHAFEDKDRPDHGHASWMPYQEKQAIKHAAEEVNQSKVGTDGTFF